MLIIFYVAYFNRIKSYGRWRKVSKTNKCIRNEIRGSHFYYVKNGTAPSGNFDHSLNNTRIGGQPTTEFSFNIFK